MLAVGCSGLIASGDIVFCETGDQFHGKVVAVDEKEVKIRSEIAGEVKIPRERVLSITFKEPSAKTTAKVLPGEQLPAAASATNGNKIDAEAIAKVQQEFLATATPEAQAMYRDMVQGFLSGKVSVQDLRGQAQDALNQLNELSKDLDDEEISGILGTYGSILQNFLKQTGGTVTNSPAVKRPAIAADAEEE